MCGIAGIIRQPHTALPDLAERLARMAQAMTHRGPDDEGLAISATGQVGFANRRLAIRDLSPAGHMPMQTTDGAVTITYNGEIYNAGELRTELAALGYPFRSQSDTEVILLGYVAWGKAIVNRLRGMFVFAILDQRQGPHTQGTVLLARDHLGIKPLYYAQTSAGDWGGGVGGLSAPGQCAQSVDHLPRCGGAAAGQPDRDRPGAAAGHAPALLEFADRHRCADTLR